MQHACCCGCAGRYRLWKQFKLWRSAVRSKLIGKRRAKLEKTLFWLDDMFQATLLEIRKLCGALRKNSLTVCKPDALYTLEKCAPTQHCRSAASHRRALQAKPSQASVALARCRCSWPQYSLPCAVVLYVCAAGLGCAALKHESKPTAVRSALAHSLR